MLNIITLLIATIITALVSLVGGFLLLSGSKLAKTFQKIGPYFAVIILFYAAFGDIIPEILEEEALPVWQVAILIGAGVLLCAGLGLIMGRFHHHGDKKHNLKNKKQAITMLIVDSFHTAADGIVMGVAFASGIGTGITAAVATIAHEIPQEIGDFSIMQRSKIPVRNIIKLQIISGLILVPVALISYFIGDHLEQYLPVALALVAGSLIYIAIVEIVHIIQDIKAKAPKVKQANK